MAKAKKSGSKKKKAPKKATVRKAQAKKKKAPKKTAGKAPARKRKALKKLPKKAAGKAPAVKKGAGRRPQGSVKSRFSAATLEKFRRVLLTTKKRIRGDYDTLRNTHLRSSQRDSTGDLSGYSMHMADVGTDTYDREFGLSVVTSEGNTLYAIDEALGRIEAKTYGKCEGCDCRIKLTRLKAVPWASLCINCKKKLEKANGKGF